MGDRQNALKLKPTTASRATRRRSKEPPTKVEDSDERNIFDFTLFSSAPPIGQSAASSSAPISTSKSNVKSKEQKQNKSNNKDELGSSPKNRAGLFAAFAKGAKKLPKLAGTSTASTSVHSKKSSGGGGDDRLRAPSPLERNIFAELAKSTGESTSQNGDIHEKNTKKKTNVKGSFVFKKPPLQSSSGTHSSEPVSSSKPVSSSSKSVSSSSSSSSSQRTKTQIENETPGTETSSSKVSSSTSKTPKSSSLSPEQKMQKGDLANIFASISGGKKTVQNKEKTKIAEVDVSASQKSSSDEVRVVTAVDKIQPMDVHVEESDAAVDLPDGGDIVDLKNVEDRKVASPTNVPHVADDVDVNLIIVGKEKTTREPCNETAQLKKAVKSDVKDKNLSKQERSRSSVATTGKGALNDLRFSNFSEVSTEFVNILEEEERIPKPIVDTGGIPVLDKIGSDSDVEELAGDQPPPLDIYVDNQGANRSESTELAGGLGNFLKEKTAHVHKHTHVHRHGGVHKHSDVLHKHTCTHKHTPANKLTCTHKHTCGKKKLPQHHTCSKAKEPVVEQKAPIVEPKVISIVEPKTPIVELDDRNDDLEVILVRKKKKKKKKKRMVEGGQMAKGDKAEGDKIKDGKSKQDKIQVQNDGKADDADIVLVEDSSDSGALSTNKPKSKPNQTLAESSRSSDVASAKHNKKVGEVTVSASEAAAAEKSTSSSDADQSMKNKDLGVAVSSGKGELQEVKSRSGNSQVNRESKSKDISDDSDVQLVSASEDETVESKRGGKTVGVEDKSGKIDNDRRETGKDKPVSDKQGDKMETKNADILIETVVEDEMEEEENMEEARKVDVTKVDGKEKNDRDISKKADSVEEMKEAVEKVEDEEHLNEVETIDDATGIVEKTAKMVEKAAEKVEDKENKVETIGDVTKMMGESSKTIKKAAEKVDDDDKVYLEAENMQTDAPAEVNQVESSKAEEVQTSTPQKSADLSSAPPISSKETNDETETREGQTGTPQTPADPSSAPLSSSKETNDETESVQTEESNATIDMGLKSVFDVSFTSEDSMDVSEAGQMSFIDSFLDNSSNFSFAGTEDSSELGSSFGIRDTGTPSMSFPGTEESSEVGSTLGNTDIDRPSTSQEDIDLDGGMYEGSPDVDDIDGITFLSFDSRDQLSMHLESLTRPKKKVAEPVPVEEKKKKKPPSTATNANPDVKKQRKKKKSVISMMNKPKTWVALNYHALMNELEESEEKMLEELEIHANREFLHPALKDAGMCLQISSLESDPVGKVFNLDPVGIDLSYQEPPRVSQRDIFFPQRTKTSDYTKVKGWRDTEDEGKKWKTLLLPHSLKNQKPGPKGRGKPSKFVKPQQVPYSKQKTPPQAAPQSAPQSKQLPKQPKKNLPAAQHKRNQAVSQAKKSPPSVQTRLKTVPEVKQKVQTVPKIKITGMVRDQTRLPVRRTSREITKPRYLDDTVDDNFIAQYVKSVKKPGREKPEREADKTTEREPIKLIIPKPKPTSPKPSKPLSPVVPPITLSFKKPKTAAEAAKYGIKSAKIIKKQKTPVLDEWDTPQAVSGLKKPVKDFAALLSKKLEGDDADGDSDKHSAKIPVEESRFFKPFEKPVTSKKSAFVSSSLDEYLERGKDDKTSEYNPFSHPLLQNKSAVVTFQMPTKQQRGIKTLKQKLEENRLLALKRRQSLSSTADNSEKSDRKVDQSENKITVKPFIPHGKTLSQHIDLEKKKNASEETRDASKTDFTSVLSKGLNERIAYLKGETFEKKIKERLEQISGNSSPFPESEDSGSDDVYSRSGPRTLGHITGTCRTKATEIKHSYKKARTKATETKNLYKSKPASDSDDIEIISSDNSDSGAPGGKEKTVNQPPVACRTKASETVRYGGLAEAPGSKKANKKSAMVKVAKDKIKASQNKSQNKLKGKDTSKPKWKTQLQIVNNKLVHNTKPIILSKSSSSSFMPVRDPNSPPMKSIMHSTLAPRSKLADDADATKKDVNKSVIITDLEECVIEDDSDHDIEEVEPLPACGKEFCRLGCVCDSLERAANPYRPRTHCSKAECMFKCVCATEKVRILRNRKRPSYFNSEDMFFYDTEGMMSNIHEKKRPRLLAGPLVEPTQFTCARTRLFNGCMSSSSTHRPKELATTSKPTNSNLGSLVLKQSGSDYVLRVDSATKQIFAVSLRDPNEPVKMLPAKLKSVTPISSGDQTVRFETVVSKGASLQPYFTNLTPKAVTTTSPIRSAQDIATTTSSSSTSVVPSTSQAFPVSLTKVSEADNTAATTTSGEKQVSASIMSSHAETQSSDVIMESIAQQSSEEVIEVVSSSDGNKKKKKKKKKEKKHKKDKDRSMMSSIQGNPSTVALPQPVSVGVPPDVGNTVLQGGSTPMQQVLTVSPPGNPVVPSQPSPMITNNPNAWQNIATQGGRLIIGGASLGNWVSCGAIPSPTVKTTQSMPSLVGAPVIPTNLGGAMIRPVRPNLGVTPGQPANLGTPVHPGFPAPVRLPSAAVVNRNPVGPAVLINGKPYKLVSSAPGEGNVSKIVALPLLPAKIGQTSTTGSSTGVPVSQPNSSPSVTLGGSNPTITLSPTISPSIAVPVTSPLAMVPKTSLASTVPQTTSPSSVVTKPSMVVTPTSPSAALTTTSTSSVIPLTTSSVLSPLSPAITTTMPSPVMMTTSPSPVATTPTLSQPPVVTLSPSVGTTSPASTTPKTSPPTDASKQTSSGNSQKILSGPMLIEIQSDCNWDKQKNEILSEIAKHTSAVSKQVGAAPGRTHVRVGKYVVEIVNKQAQPSTSQEGVTPSSVVAKDGVKKSTAGVKKGVKTSPTKMCESKPPVELGTEVSHEGVTTFFPPTAKKAPPSVDDEVICIDDHSQTKPSESGNSTTKQAVKLVKRKKKTKNDSGITHVTKSIKTPISSVLAMDDDPGSPDIIEMTTSDGQKDDLEIIDVPDSPERSSSTLAEGKKLAVKSSEQNKFQIRLARPTAKESDTTTSGAENSVGVSALETAAVQSTVASDEPAPVPVGIICASDLNTTQNQPPVVASENMKQVSLPTSMMTTTALTLATNRPERRHVNTSLGSLPVTPNKPVPMKLYCSSPMLTPSDNEPTPQKSDSSSEDSDSSSDSDAEIVVDDDPEEQLAEELDIETVDPHLDTVVESLKRKLGMSQFRPIRPKAPLVRKGTTRSPVVIDFSGRAAVTVIKSNKTSTNQHSSKSKKKRKSPVLGKPGEPEFYEAVDNKEEVSEQEKLRTHNVLERQRRLDMRDRFAALRDEVFVPVKKKAAKVHILKRALEDITRLESQAEKLKNVKTKLQEINYQLTSKLAVCCGVRNLTIPKPVEQLHPVQRVGPQTEYDRNEAVKQAAKEKRHEQQRSLSSSAASSPVLLTSSQSSPVPSPVLSHVASPEPSPVPSPTPSSPILYASPSPSPPPATSFRPLSRSSSSSSEVDIAHFVDSSEEEGGDEDDGADEMEGGGEESEEDRGAEMVSDDDDNSNDFVVEMSKETRKLSGGLTTFLNAKSLTDSYHPSGTTKAAPSKIIGGSLKFTPETDNSQIYFGGTQESASTMKDTTKLPQIDSSVDERKKSIVLKLPVTSPPPALVVKPVNSPVGERKTSSVLKLPIMPPSPAHVVIPAFHVGLPKVVSVSSHVQPKAAGLPKKSPTKVTLLSPVRLKPDATSTMTNTTTIDKSVQKSETVRDTVNVTNESDTRLASPNTATSKDKSTVKTWKESEASESKGRSSAEYDSSLLSMERTLKTSTESELQSSESTPMSKQMETDGSVESLESVSPTVERPLKTSAESELQSSETTPVSKQMKNDGSVESLESKSSTVDTYLPSSSKTQQSEECEQRKEEETFEQDVEEKDSKDKTDLLSLDNNLASQTDSIQKQNRDYHTPLNEFQTEPSESSERHPVENQMPSSSSKDSHIPPASNELQPEPSESNERRPIEHQMLSSSSLDSHAHSLSHELQTEPSESSERRPIEHQMLSSSSLDSHAHSLSHELQTEPSESSERRPVEIQMRSSSSTELMPSQESAEPMEEDIPEVGLNGSQGGTSPAVSQADMPSAASSVQEHLSDASSWDPLHKKTSSVSSVDMQSAEPTDQEMADEGALFSPSSVDMQSQEPMDSETGVLADDNASSMDETECAIQNIPQPSRTPSPQMVSTASELGEFSSMEYGRESVDHQMEEEDMSCEDTQASTKDAPQQLGGDQESEVPATVSDSEGQTHYNPSTCDSQNVAAEQSCDGYVSCNVSEQSHDDCQSSQADSESSLKPNVDSDSSHDRTDPSLFESGSDVFSSTGEVDPNQNLSSDGPESSEGKTSPSTLKNNVDLKSCLGVKENPDGTMRVVLQGHYDDEAVEEFFARPDVMDYLEKLASNAAGQRSNLVNNLL